MLPLSQIRHSQSIAYIDESPLRAAKIAAARAGKRDYEIFEEALRRHLGFTEVVERIWAGISEQDAPSEEEAPHRRRGTGRHAGRTRHPKGGLTPARADQGRDRPERLDRRGHQPNGAPARVVEAVMTDQVIAVAFAAKVVCCG